jgi:hypothetical protein
MGQALGDNRFHLPQTHTITATNNYIGAMNLYVYSQFTESLFINNS